MGKMTLAELSTESLTKRRNLLKGVLTGFGVMWLMILALAIYFYIAKSTTKLFLPMAIFPMTLLPLFLQLKPLNTELKNRKQQ